MESFKAKYGQPITAEGQCGITIADIVRDEGRSVFDCKELWRSEGRNIKVYWAIEKQRLNFLGIDYLPLSSEI